MAGDPHPEGWSLPVAQALATPVLMAGMPREYAIAMGTIALVLGLAAHLVAGVAVVGLLPCGRPMGRAVGRPLLRCPAAAPGAAG